MYFHLIGIKEKDGEKYDLDLLLQGGDENLVRKFLGYRGVVIVSIIQFKEDPETFGNIRVLVSFEGTDIEILTKGESLEPIITFFYSLGLSPHFVNYVNDAITLGEMQGLMDSCLEKIRLHEEQIKKEAEEKALKERKKYEENVINDTLKIINIEIDHIDQVIKAGHGVISPNDIKRLEDLGNEMKKVRLGTNFNRMASLLIDTHELTKKAENEILSGDNSKSFLIDKNSITTNIDFISELSNFNRVSEKAVIQPSLLTTDESIRNMLGTNSVLIRMLLKDFFNTFEHSSISEFLEITVSYIEYVILIVIVIFSILWSIGPLLGFDEFSLYLLPALGWLGLLVYLFNSLNFKGTISKIIGLIVLAIIYWYGLILLKGTFAL